MISQRWMINLQEVIDSLIVHWPLIPVWDTIGDRHAKQCRHPSGGHSVYSYQYRVVSFCHLIQIKLTYQA